jgi:phosphatidylinositol alpha-1,6-mannosyltransferase
VDDSIHLWAPSFTGFGGGIAAFSRELATALGNEGSLRLIGKADRGRSWKGHRLHGAGQVIAPFRTGYFATILVVFATVRRPKVIISTHVHFGPVAYALSHILRIPFVLVAHGVEIDPQLSALRRRALRGAQAVWSVSRWTRSRLVAVGVREGAIHLLPDTVSQERFDIGSRNAELVARHSLAGDERVILTVARLVAAEGYKGCDRVLMALPAILRAEPSVRYLIVGTGDDVIRLRRLAESLGVDRHVTFCGFVPDDELPAYYRLADVFAMPSTGEGFGIAFLEALASGVPVLGGNRDGTTDALADGELGLLVDPDSVDAISKGVVSLLRGEGPPLWFDRQLLRARCLQRFGEAPFRRRVHDALNAVLMPAGRE